MLKYPYLRLVAFAPLTPPSWATPHESRGVNTHTMKKRIIMYPAEEKLLRTPSQPVTRFDTKFKRLIQDLTDTLYSQPGVGISAVQIGVLQRVALIRLGQTHEGDGSELGPPIPLINPKILASEGEVRDYDSCLSAPHLYGYTYRPQKISVWTMTADGGEQVLELNDLDARVALHEMDHLDGVLFMDRIRSQDDLYIIRGSKNGQPIWTRMSDVEKMVKPK